MFGYDSSVTRSFVDSESASGQSRSGSQADGGHEDDTRRDLSVTFISIRYTVVPVLRAERRKPWLLRAERFLPPTGAVRNYRKAGGEVSGRKKTWGRRASRLGTPHRQPRQKSREGFLEVTDTNTFVSRRERRRQAKPSLARAVASNAGTVGRGTAAAVAASGLVISSGVAANASTDSQGREVTTLQVSQSDLSVERASNNSSVSVAASPNADLAFDRPEVESAPAPEPEPEPEPVEEEPEPELEQVQEDQGGEQEQEETQASSEEQSEEPPSDGDGGNSSVVSAAYSGLGNPYVFGGKGPGGWDCSGFVSWAYAQAGMGHISGNTTALMGSPHLSQTSNPQPGDIVVQNGGGHVAIYVGNGQMIGAQNPSTGTIQYGQERNTTDYYLTPR